VRLLMLAPPGAGKGTQGRRLAEHYGIEHISTGEMLRQEVAAGTPGGRTAKEYLDRGDLVPDELMSRIVLDRVTKATGNGFILDAYPRNLAQAEVARKLAVDNGITIDGVVYLDVSRDELLRRLLHRGGQSPGADVGGPDVGGGERGGGERGGGGDEQRSDDNEATIRHRLEVFDLQTRPLVDYFRERGLLISVNGEQPVEQVTQAIIDQLDASMATRSPAPGPPPPDGGSR
jgi:adenylate kinase